MLRRVTEKYVEECSAPDSRLRHAAHEMNLPATYGESYGRLMLDRPLFASESEISGFAADLSGLFDILTSLPARLFGGDLRRYCDALGMDGRLAELMCRGASGRPPLYARADAYHDGSAFKLLELNIGSQLGGTDFAQLNRAFLDVPAFKEFAQEHRLGHIDTLARLTRTLRETGGTVTDGEPVVALIEARGGIDAHRHVFDALREAMLDHGVRLLLGEVQELGERNGKVTLRGAPLDVVLRYFVASEVADDRAGQDSLDLLVRAHHAGRTVLYTPLEGAMFASKGSLALLHDPRTRETFSPAEHAVVDRVMPWTRLLGADRHTAAQHAELLDRCREQQEDLVLKPGVGHGGVGTVIGHEVTEEQWRQALLDRAAGDHVVQERVRPVPEPVVDAETGAVADWVANWGVFVDTGGYAGGFVRALKPDDGAVVAFANPGTRSTCVFTAP
ncbi:hypothetical protein OG897_36075 [Streptomyces sp. NBC_00237]|uniref:hypothetical protein n=1 Tax=Streptomyces sp. NBC_00237 TaxID=2975687 RepID=UPI002258EE5F|nr:hypothetical protein [Streptomyces sp. NBC_00237]MCX5206804.1 hypothetical protein [Streptomyces sp. NBC_00237]